MTPAEEAALLRQIADFLQNSVTMLHHGQTPQRIDALRDGADAIESEAGRVKVMLDQAAEIRAEWTRAEKAEAERDRLREALERYGRHDDGCTRSECDCGLLAARGK